jgi:hypothetical protein
MTTIQTYYALGGMSTGLLNSRLTIFANFVLELPPLLRRAAEKYHSKDCQRLPGSC